VARFECPFPLVAFLDSDVVIAPSDVEFAEYFYPLQVLDTLCKVWEWCDVFAGNSVEGSIVNDVLGFLQVLFRDTEG